MNSARSSDSARPPLGAPLTPAAELQRRWRLGEEPQIETFLTEWPVSSLRDLAAITRVDLRQRWRRGERPGAHDYLARFPQLRSQSELVVDVIYAEYLVREELGHHPLVADLQRQFPEYAAELGDQIELHRALDAGEEWPQTADETQKPMLSTATLGAGAGSTNRLPPLGPDYEILAEIGRGGMGVVYRARQVSLNRLVALKMVRAADCASPELLARFRAEAEAVARLHHSKIVQIYDYGEHNGLPYLALELVEGSTLAAKLDGRPWPASRAADLIEALARAVQFAHQHGVIHRDLKPANILLHADCAKIADFGLAKVFGEGTTTHTQTGAVLGTPSYMAPEQAVGQAQRIGPPTDVYALGAILYELLTGRPPFQAESALKTLQQVITQEPVSLWRQQPRLSRDLVTICAKCLNKEPRQRYASAGELADDLGRYLADQPIRARPTSKFERGWRWCRRNPVLALLSGSVAVLLLTVATVASVFSIHLKAQLNRIQLAEDAERHANQSAQLRLFDSYLAEAAARHGTRRIGQRFSTLETVDKANVALDEVGRTPERVLRLRNAMIAALAQPDLRGLRQIAGWPSQGVNIAFSAAADRYVGATSSGDLFVYRLADGWQLLRIGHQGTDAVPSISQDGTHVAISDTRGSKTWRIDAAPPTIVWEELDAAHLTFSPDSRHAAVSGADRQMHLLELASGQKIRQLGRGAARSRFAFHSASQRIAVCGTEHVQVLSAELAKYCPSCRCRRPARFFPASPGIRVANMLRSPATTTASHSGILLPLGA